METWRKYLNSVLLSIIIMMLTTGSILFDRTLQNMNIKYDLIDVKIDMLGQKVSDAVLISTVNTERIIMHNNEAQIWKNKMTALESGQHKATMDRITKTEVYNAINSMKDWADKNFARK